MFVRDAEVQVRQDKNGRFFYYKGYDLDKDPLFLPTSIEGMLGTVELTRHRIILHPQDGKDESYSVDQFLNFCESMACRRKLQ